MSTRILTAHRKGPGGNCGSELHTFPNTDVPIKLLRIFLGLAAITWLAAVPAVFMTWDAAAAAMEGFGARPIEYDKMLDYWLRMASCAFALIGCLYLLPTFNPPKFQAFIPWLGLLALIEGIVLLVHGLRLHLSPWPLYGDVAACLVSGTGILASWKTSQTQFGTQTHGR